jgi:Domain of unknown function (DUF4145)
VKQTTEFLRCRHCGNFAPMNIVANYFLLTEPESVYEYSYYPEECGDPHTNKINIEYAVEYNPDDYDDAPNAGCDYSLLLCLACKEVTLRKSCQHDFMDLETIEMGIETLYPPQGLELSYLPSAIQKAYKAALKARSINVDAYAILLGSTLDMVCEERKAEGKNIYEKLKFLAENGEIPNNLVEVVHKIRQLRNVGAHEPFKGLTSKEIPVLDDLIRAILEYLYVAPNLARKAVMHLQGIKDRKSKLEDGDIRF